MNAELIEDLKQFIDAKFSQQDARIDEKLDNLRDELRSEFHTAISDLREEMHAGFAGVADAMEDYNKDVDARLTVLEQRAA